MHLGWPEIVIALLFLMLTIVPIWVAARARPLGTLSYKWATWVAIETAIVTFAVFAIGIPLIGRRGFDGGASLYLLFGVFGLIGAAGLFQRKRVGAVFTIISGLYLIILGPLLYAIDGRVQPANQGANTPALLVMVIINIFYFRKRWGAMGPLRPSVLKATS